MPTDKAGTFIRPSGVIGECGAGYKGGSDGAL